MNWDLELRARHVALAGQIVYFVRHEHHGIKIGTTRQFDGRIRSLNSEYGTLVLLAFEAGGWDREQHLHRRFTSLRVRPRGEWFRPGRDLLLHIDALTADGGFPITFEAPEPIPGTPQYGQ